MCNTSTEVLCKDKRLKSVVKCVGSDRRELNRLYHILCGIQCEWGTLFKNCNGKVWLGTLFDELGISLDWLKISDEWSELEMEDGVITFRMNTYNEVCSVLSKRIMRDFPTVEVLYQSVNHSSREYYSNDVEGSLFPERYAITLQLDDMLYFRLFEDLESASGWLGQMTGYDVKNLEDAGRFEYQLNSEHDHASCQIYRFVINGNQSEDVF